MSNNKTITIWIAAYLENAGKYYGWDVSPSDILIEHFRTKGIIMYPSDLDLIINNSTSTFHDLISKLEVNLVTSGVYNGPESDYHLQIAAQQWGEANILNDKSLALTNFTSYPSMSSLSMNWVMDPEPAAYIFATLDLKLTKKQSMALMSW
jgi:hypothetical protein